MIIRIITIRIPLVAERVAQLAALEFLFLLLVCSMRHVTVCLTFPHGVLLCCCFVGLSGGYCCLIQLVAVRGALIMWP